MLIDTHTHLYMPAFDGDRAAVMQRAMAAGIAECYLPAIDAEVMDRLLQMEADYPGVCKAMAGLHPCSVGANCAQELDVVADWLRRRPFAALGEIGLDFYWDSSNAAVQLMAFEVQMEWALEYGLPIVIHSRNAMQQTLAAVGPFAKRGLKGIFHCFSGNAAEAQQVVDMGFLLGIGGVVTYKNSGLAQALVGIDLQHLVLETDAPYLTPVPHRGKRNETGYVSLVAECVAGIYGVPATAVAEQTTANARGVFLY
ncbi:MAG: TatD family deoxyribonuclease [Bacteroidetes bacterium]|nr:MAG: TatD family deoxyribonuclease [Bacteroidota bacterium]